MLSAALAAVNFQWFLSVLWSDQNGVCVLSNAAAESAPYHVLVMLVCLCAAYQYMGPPYCVASCSQCQGKARQAGMCVCPVFKCKQSSSPLLLLPLLIARERTSIGSPFVVDNDVCVWTPAIMGHGMRADVWVCYRGCQCQGQPAFCTAPCANNLTVVMEWMVPPCACCGCLCVLCFCTGLTLGLISAGCALCLWGLFIISAGDKAVCCFQRGRGVALQSVLPAFPSCCKVCCLCARGVILVPPSGLACGA